MKIQKAEFAMRLNKIKGVVPKKAKKEVLQGVLVKDGYLIANNLETTVKAKIDGIEGECFIIPERAFDLINNLPEGEVDISATAKNTITIKADKIKNKYQAMDPVLFPLPDIQEGENKLTIKADTLLESIKHVSYAVAKGGNVTMSSLCLQASEGQLNFVGLDGHVMAWDRVEYDGEFELLIPKNTVDKLKSLGLHGDVQLMHTKTGVVFVTNDFEVYTRLVDRKYYKYQKIFQELPLHTVVSRTELLDAITRTRMCAKEKCPVILELQDKQLKLRVKDEITEYHETVDLQEKFATPLTIGFNARLVLETLEAFGCENIGISFSGPKMPMMVEAEDGNFKAVVLPVTI